MGQRTNGDIPTGAVVLAGLAVLPPFLVAGLSSPGRRFALVAEDGPVEWVGATAWGIAAIAFLLALRGRRRGAPHPLWLLGLALISLLAAGEEISWGQRVFDYETPSSVAESNLQREMNLHNLRALDGRVTADGSVKKEGLAAWLTFNRMGFLLWAGFLVALPLLCGPSGIARPLARRLRLPVAPLGVAGAALLSYAASRLLFEHGSGAAVDGLMLRVAADEIHETVVAVLFAVSALALARRAHVGGRADETAGSGGT